MSKDLRSKLIRLAHQKPHLRKDLLPLLTEKKIAGITPVVFADFSVESGNPEYGDDYYNWFGFIVTIKGISLSDQNPNEIKGTLSKLIVDKSYNTNSIAVRIEPTADGTHNLFIYQNNRISNIWEQSDVFSTYKKKVNVVMDYIEKVVGVKLGSPIIKIHEDADALYDVGSKYGWTSSNFRSSI